MATEFTNVGAVRAQGTHRRTDRPERNEEREQYIRETRYMTAVSAACDAYFARKGMERLSLHQLRGMTRKHQQEYRLANLGLGEDEGGDE